MPSSVEEADLDGMELEEQPLYKCHFCNVMFESIISIVKHNNFYCVRRNRLPRSATVTSSSALDDDPSTSEKSPEEKDSESSEVDVVGGVPEDGSASCSSDIPNIATMPIEDVAEYLRKKFSVFHNSATANFGAPLTPLADVKPNAKRKMAEVREESKEEGPSPSNEEDEKCQKSRRQS